MSRKKVDDFFEHFGVKGMKWGVRRKSASTSDVQPTSPARKKASEMTDDELKKAIDRLNMEKTYKSLVAASAPATSPGAKFIQQLLADSSRDAGRKLLSAALFLAGKKAIERSLGVKIKEEMFPEGKKKEKNQN